MVKPKIVVVMLPQRGALSKLANNLLAPGNSSDLDFQMNTFEQILLNEKGRILSAPISLKEATEVIFEAIEKRKEELVSGTQCNCKY